MNIYANMNRKYYVIPVKGKFEKETKMTTAASISGTKTKRILGLELSEYGTPR